MSFAIIRGSNGRRHEVDFANAEIEVDVAIGNETVQITVEAVDDLAPSDKTALCHHGLAASDARAAH